MVEVQTLPDGENNAKELIRRGKRVYAFSYIRAIACIAIIVLHTVFSGVLLFGGSISEVQNISSRIVANCLMWAVPCFIMVTGALLLDKTKVITYKKLFRKYILRILAALVIFGMIFRVFDMVLDAEPVNINGFLVGVSEIFTGEGWSHLWYLYLLIGLYLLLPFYKKIAEYSSQRDIKYLLLVYVAFLSVIPALQVFGINCGFYIHVSTIYPFFLFCGYAIHGNILDIKKGIYVLVFTVSTFFIILLTIIRWKYNISSMDILWSYSSILVILQAAGLFGILQQLSFRTDGYMQKVLNKIDECSFGIYLVHMMFVRLFLRYQNFNPYEKGGIIAFLLVIIIIFALSYIVVKILKKVPVFRKIL